MSIANSTLHFHFPLVVGTDRPLFEDYNQAMETLDEKLYESISTLETIPQEITDLQTAVSGLAEQITALETFETEQTGTNQLVNNAILALQQAVAIIPTKFDSAGIADPYDAEHGIYSVGDVVTYNGQRYECSQAVTAAEPFDADKWNAVDVQTEIDDIKYKLITKTGDGSSVSLTTLLNSLYVDIDAFGDISGDSYLDIGGNVYTFKAHSTNVYIFTRVQVTNASIVGDTIEVRATNSENYRAVVTASDVTFSTRGTTTPLNVKLYYKLA